MDLKKLHRNPPLVDLPSASEILASQPLIGALPPTVRRPLEAGARMQTKLRGSVLTHQGDYADGVRLISSGRVRGASLELLCPVWMPPTPLWLEWRQPMPTLAQ